jgi:hypothetical protein
MIDKKSKSRPIILTIKRETLEVRNNNSIRVIVTSNAHANMFRTPILMTSTKHGMPIFTNMRKQPKIQPSIVAKRLFTPNHDQACFKFAHKCWIAWSMMMPVRPSACHLCSIKTIDNAAPSLSDSLFESHRWKSQCIFDEHKCCRKRNPKQPLVRTYTNC